MCPFPLCSDFNVLCDVGMLSHCPWFRLWVLGCRPRPYGERIHVHCALGMDGVVWRGLSAKLQPGPSLTKLSHWLNMTLYYQNLILHYRLVWVKQWWLFLALKCSDWLDKRKLLNCLSKSGRPFSYFLFIFGMSRDLPALPLRSIEDCDRLVGPVAVLGTGDPGSCPGRHFCGGRHEQ